MRLINLDFIDIIDNVTLHNYLEEKLELPSYYGRNLDGLWDFLLEISEYTLIELRHINSLYDNLGAYSAKFLRTLDDAALENTYIWLKVMD